MAVSSTTVQIKSRGENDIIDITWQASKAVKESQAENGIVTVFVVGSTAAITTIEYEPGLKLDFPDALSKRQAAIHNFLFAPCEKTKHCGTFYSINFKTTAVAFVV